MRKNVFACLVVLFVVCVLSLFFTTLSFAWSPPDDVVVTDRLVDNVFARFNGGVKFFGSPLFYNGFGVISGNIGIGANGAYITASGDDLLFYDAAYGVEISLSELADVGECMWTESGDDIYYDSGSVGIGTTAPDYELDVSGDIRITNRLYFWDTARYIEPVSSELNYYADTGHHFSINTGEKMTISSSGNVGIGTTTPGVKLDVVNSNGVAGEIRSYAAETNYTELHHGQIIIKNNGSSVGLLDADHTGTSATLVNIKDGGNSVFYIANGGNVGIGTTSPSVELDVEGDIKASGTVLSGGLGSWVNVKAHGAVGNGVTDDTAAIQSAIDSRTNGGVIYVPAGTYYITDYITLWDNITLIGDGDSTVLKFVGAHKAVNATNVDNVRLESVYIDASDVTGTCGVHFTGVNNSIVKDVTVYQGYEMSFCFSDGAGQPCNNCIIENCRAIEQRIWNAGSSKASFIAAGPTTTNIKFINCYAQNCNADMFDSDDAHLVSFINCTADTTTGGQYGFWSESEAVSDTYDVIWSNCVAINTGGGFGITGNTNGVIDNCIAKNTTNNYGILVDGASAKISGCYLVNCTSYNNQQNNGAIGILTDDQVIVSNCAFKDTVCDYDIMINHSGIVEGPYIITGCNFNNGVRLGETNTTMSTVVSNNTFSNCWLSNYNDTYNVVVDGNLFVGGGVYFAMGYNVVITNNIFRDLGNNNAISLLFGCDYAQVSNNLINGAEIGIVIEGATAHATVTNNTIYNCSTDISNTATGADNFDEPNYPNYP